MDEFREAIRAVGLEPPEYIEPGALHRFPGIGKGNGNKAGWCKLFEDGRGGVFGDWAADLQETWQAKRDNPMSAKDRAEFRREVKAAKEKAEAERKAAQAEAADKAASIWEAATPAPAEHGYLSAKGIQPHGVRVNDGHLVIPMRDGGNLHSLQVIDADGNKRFLPGGRVTGCYYSIGKPDGTVCVAEGFATAASVHEATGYAVAAAFNAGNLELVAKSLRQRFPDVRIIVCGDNDESGVGQDKAREAAQAVNGVVAIPPMTGDFNDLHQAQGMEAVKACIEATTPLPGPVNFRRLSDVNPKPIRWLWPGRIARGKPTVIAGDPGLGKSQITASIAAITSTGGRWPVDRSSAERGNVVVLSAEDDPGDTIRPRLDAAEADVSRVYVIDSVIDEERERHFSLARDIERLGDLIHRIGNVRLVIIDPISAYLGGTDSHKNSDIRELLAPLGKLAAKHDAAFVLVSHLNKSGAGHQNALGRITGSLAFVAAARAVYVVGRDKDDDSRRLFLPAKNNIGPDTTGLAYRIEGATVGKIETSRVAWEAEPVEVTADEILGSALEPNATKQEQAVELLQRFLKDGPQPQEKCIREGKLYGISDRTLKRAKSEAGVESFKRQFSGEWYWRLEGDQSEGCQPQGHHLASFDETQHSCGFQEDSDPEGCQGSNTGNGGTLGGDGGVRVYTGDDGVKVWETA